MVPIRPDTNLVLNADPLRNECLSSVELDEQGVLSDSHREGWSARQVLRLRGLDCPIPSLHGKQLTSGANVIGGRNWLDRHLTVTEGPESWAEESWLGARRADRPTARGPWARVASRVLCPYISGV